MLNIGEISKFRVLRKTDISYLLNPIDDKCTEVFLHLHQATEELKENQIIEAFLFYDNKHRLCATMEKPIITTSNYGFVEVNGVSEHIGCFVNIGIVKDILLSKDYLPANTKAWPQVGDKLPCILKVKKDSLVARIISRNDIIKNDLLLNIKDKTTATICHFSSTGIICYTNNFEAIYIHKSLLRNKYRIGQIVEPTIININEYNEYNGSLIEQKEKMISTDSEMILKYLNTFGGIIKLGDASTPEEIAKVFPLSKSAFKRAIGYLYKERIITISDYSIKLVDKKIED